MITARRKIRWRSIVPFSLILGCLLGFQNVNASPSAQDISQAEAAGNRNERDLLRYLVPALRQAGEAGRIYYAASCLPDDNYPDPFPKLDVREPTKGAFGLAAVREIFQGDTNVEVEERPAGIIRIRIGKVPDEILQTAISHITLDPLKQYNAPKAIAAIEASDEVRAAMNKLGIQELHRPIHREFVFPASGLPHLSASIDNVTVEQALDLVALTFRGIVVYGACTNPSRYTLAFTGGRGFDELYTPP